MLEEKACGHTLWKGTRATRTTASKREQSLKTQNASDRIAGI
ncbi:hypothetical protein PJE062_1641 [Pseudovibrio sp. JE062]|nr:hypothetical protein PJE062_1641 [Pseudovibrio sp. JE062]